MRSLRTFVSRRAFAMAAALAVAVLAGSGCGGKDKGLTPDTVLAKVGDKEITAGYYEKKLGRLNPVDLPRDDEGNSLDTAEMAGKRRFLDTIINKDVMVAVAEQMGFGSDPQIEYARKTLTSFEAVAAVRERLVNVPASKVDEADINKFYEKLGTVRKCRYFICNTREKALRGREQALTGADWADLFREFHDGAQGDKVSFNMDIHFGRFVTAFEDPIFATKVGEITEPVSSTYGWWILKIDSEEQTERPPLEEVRRTVIASITSRNQMRLIEEYKSDVRAKYKMYLNEDALVKAYEGLPPDEALFYPNTQEPVKREDLVPLELDPRDFDMDFYGYTVKGEPRKYTLGDFKAAYDRMSVFERPKWADMLGGVRSKITDEIDRALFNFDSEERGLHTDPEVVAKVNEKVEELLINRLFEDSVHADKHVSPAALDSAWALTKDKYIFPEMRSGKRMILADQAAADRAHAALVAGEYWRAVRTAHGVAGDDQTPNNRIEYLRSNATGPERDAMFGLQMGAFSRPFALEDGSYEIVLLEKIDPARNPALAEVAEQVGKNIQNKREEMAFRVALDAWKKQIPIVVNEDKLAKTRSWKELNDAAKAVETPAAGGK